MLLKMESTPVGSGMGTSGLVGPLQTFATMNPNHPAWVVILEIVVMYVILPAAICLGLSELMRKIGWIKSGDLKLDV